MNTKLIVALAIVGVLAITVVGLVSAQAIAPTYTPSATTGSTTPYGAPIGDFWGWMGRCIGFSGAQYGTQAPTYQGYNGYGMHGMMGRYYP